MRWFSVRSNPTRAFIAATIVAVATGCPARAQQPVLPDKVSFRADSALVLVPISVVDRRGAFVTGLARDAFTVSEDGVTQQIQSFSEEDAPVSLGIVLDLSGSMKDALGTAKESLRAVLNDANPADEVFLNGVSTRPLEYSGFTRDFDEVLRRIASAGASGDTALIDTIYASLKELRSGVHTRKVLLVISDGMDNRSRHSRQELMELAVESDAQIYTIAAGGTPPAFAKPIELAEQKRGLLFLDELATKTGGIGFVVNDTADIRIAAASIGQAIRNEYVIGYVPQGNNRRGQWRRIMVKVAGSGVKAYARAGYRLE